jgi:hypothetical protein
LHKNDNRTAAAKMATAAAFEGVELVENIN